MTILHTRAHQRWLLLIVLVCACHAPAAAPSRSASMPVANALESAELAFQELRYWEDQQRLLESLGATTTPSGVGAREVTDRVTRARRALGDQLATVSAPATNPSDSSALQLMREHLAEQVAAANRDSSRAATSGVAPADSLASVVSAVLANYTRAANRIVVGRDTLNRLAILGRLSRIPNADERRALFLSLTPVWQSVNGVNNASSPYRTLVRLRAKAWRDGSSPIEHKGREFGLRSTDVEQWLVQALEAWRSVTPDSLREPWDWYFDTGAASRRLSARAPAIADIRRINDAFYTNLGASPAALGIRFDLEARAGKYPIAFTDFGTRNRLLNGRWVTGQPWVFTSYLSGGFDNLAELLHETGHGVHIAAIRTRPAFVDWPDDDTFTEALADLAALELYEPAWQQRYLGDSVRLAESLRAKYASIMMDMAWGLFEIRLHRDPTADPNALWSEITARYLRIRPHPEWSWWAMRGQLIESPGYLINYALGSFLVADMREAVRTRWGSFTTADHSMYAHLSDALYRYGRERASGEVLAAMLGRAPSPDALLRDLRRVLP